jgi:hypothetical protein
MIKIRNYRNLKSLSVFVFLVLCLNFAILGQDITTLNGTGINEQVFIFNIGNFKCVSINDGDHYYQLNDFFFMFQRHR